METVYWPHAGGSLSAESHRRAWDADARSGRRTAHGIEGDIRPLLTAGCCPRSAQISWRQSYEPRVYALFERLETRLQERHEVPSDRWVMRRQQGQQRDRGEGDDP